ncbi:MAG: hypothetical protein Q4D33_11725 [Prevotellaceae bacterium]|nr:hypothetical protein [Prevotellaceae bacterium]
MNTVLTLSDALYEVLGDAACQGGGMSREDRGRWRDMLSGKIEMEAFQACCVEAMGTADGLRTADRSVMAKMVYGWVTGCMEFCRHSGNMDVLVKATKRHLHGLVCLDFRTMEALENLKEVLRENISKGLNRVLEWCELPYHKAVEMLKELLMLVDRLVEGLFAAARKEDELEENVERMWLSDYRRRLAMCIDNQRDELKTKAEKKRQRRSAKDTLQYMFSELMDSAPYGNKYIAHNECGMLSDEDMVEFITDNEQDFDALEEYFKYIANIRIIEELKQSWGCSDQTFYKTIYQPMDKKDTITMNFYDNSSNNPAATKVVYNVGMGSAGSVPEEAEAVDTKPLMKYVFDDVTRHKFVVALGTCQSASELLSLLRQLIDGRVLNLQDVKSKTFRETIIPYLGYETNQNALKTGLAELR